MAERESPPVPQPSEKAQEALRSAFSLRIKRRGAEAFLSGGFENSSHEEVRIVARALEVIGSPERLSVWMQMPIPALNGSTPYSLLSTSEGREQVRTVLGRIEHGVY